MLSRAQQRAWQCLFSWRSSILARAPRHLERSSATGARGSESTYARAPAESAAAGSALPVSATRSSSAGGVAAAVAAVSRCAAAYATTCGEQSA